MRRFIIPAALVAAIGTAYGAQGLGRARGNPPPAPASMELRLTPLAGDSVRVVASWTPVLDGRGRPVRDYTVRVEGPASAYVTSTTHTADTARVPLAVGDSLRVGVAANDSRGVQGAWGWSRWIVRAWGPPPAPVVTADTLAAAEPYDSSAIVLVADADARQEADRTVVTDVAVDTVELCWVAWRDGARVVPSAPPTWSVQSDDAVVLRLLGPGPTGRDCRLVAVALAEYAGAVGLAPRRYLRQALALPVVSRDKMGGGGAYGGR